MSKYDFPRNGDDISLNKLSSTSTLFEFSNNNLDMPIFYHYPDNFSTILSIEYSKILNDFQSNCYYPIYARLEESYLKRFPCHIISSVSIKSDLIFFIIRHQVSQIMILMFDIFHIAGVKMLWWLHWIFHFTYFFITFDLIVHMYIFSLEVVLDSFFFFFLYHK